MNNRIVYQRLLAGDYDGTRNFNGKPYTSIFREYADCVAQGLVKAYSNPTVIAGANVPPGAANVPPRHPAAEGSVIRGSRRRPCAGLCCAATVSRYRNN